MLLQPGGKNPPEPVRRLGLVLIAKAKPLLDDGLLLGSWGRSATPEETVGGGSRHQAGTGGLPEHGNDTAVIVLPRLALGRGQTGRER